MDKKDKDLELYLKNLDKLALAFSAGVDSSFLLYKAVEVLGPENVLALTIAGAMYPARELEEARLICKSLGVEHIIIDIDIDKLSYFKKNPKDRCYYCKKDIFTKIGKEARKRGFNHLLDGTNIDDLSDYRPGLRAIEDLGVLSPLKEVGLSKEEIRSLSYSYGIPTYQKPSMACLASRIPYGEEINSLTLDRVEKCESYLRDLGFENFRVRDHGALARIEIDREEVDKLKLTDIDKLVGHFKSKGYLYVCLDLEGYSMGSMNRSLGR